MKKIIVTALMALGLSVTGAQAASGVKVGLLTCRVDAGVGYIIGSSKKVACVYEPGRGGKLEHYAGRIGKLGVDIGFTNQSVVAWAVFAPGKINRGALKGDYAGASVEATVIAGLGANVLIGGFRKTINLQPISIQAQTG
ncbi:MAG: DUF992 domain-containing protein, partial [Rhizobiales bacterium]|nr:DUF992 domain-containing protein [Hyphomicrobiales bacterium]